MQRRSGRAVDGQNGPAQEIDAADTRPKKRGGKVRVQLVRRRRQLHDPHTLFQRKGLRAPHAGEKHHHAEAVWLAPNPPAQDPDRALRTENGRGIDKRPGEFGDRGLGLLQGPAHQGNQSGADALSSRFDIVFQFAAKPVGELGETRLRDRGSRHRLDEAPGLPATGQDGPHFGCIQRTVRPRVEPGFPQRRLQQLGQFRHRRGPRWRHLQSARI